jgi:hypothetical protein
MQIRIARSLVAATAVSCLALVGVTVAQTAGAETSTRPAAKPTTPKATCHGRGTRSCTTTTTSSTTSSSSTSPPSTWSCVTSAPEGTCGPYAYAGITNANGFNTYVTNHCWGDPTCQQTLSANNPGQWQIVARQAAGNTSVRTYPNVQQLMNN